MLQIHAYDDERCLCTAEALQRAAAGRGIPSNTAGNYTLPELNLLQQQQQQQQQQARALPFPLGVLERRSPEGPYPGKKTAPGCCIVAGFTSICSCPEDEAAK